mmetsp:Transcript_13817/g.18895  ORF Transcript_13817/g.18895 Transcript_13817/m.18895 type:complete len:195 (+) Transcript_13817:386-970(+)|eukprot:CAMPEP_0170080702 /NCGR_PEP_ID=MMETSP0019_2-20121128/16769_1 /TAXON_ID=98059 /ORGANISM="Dinobryon sp., Strain UTEXLB2267" /LENGTH=194 /DNA_ID=CAMNT_0010294795 /DNA_START=336 /DNA_END=920 /DNA_ORIENTATION=-
MYLQPEHFKYHTNEGNFRLVYGQMFDSETEDEQCKLFQTANWMNIFFHLVPAEHNTCLALNVVPKFLEGWEVQYTKGGGMTKGTANRKFILHKEGGTQPEKRSCPDSLRQTPKRLKSSHLSSHFEELSNHPSSPSSLSSSLSLSCFPWGNDDSDDQDEALWFPNHERVFSFDSFDFQLSLNEDVLVFLSEINWD